MIYFRAIRWKNVLSTGNIFTEIKLNDTPNALIIGENGAGKSTILDALTFSLFGKPFRKINKPNLINSVNQKEAVVEIEFTSNNKDYKVIRGIKPNVFEIWCNGVCLNQDSASKDYQEHLEKFILKMNYKTFCQIVILGSASFTPFMQLSPSDRRTVIEDLLDIQVFSVMNNIVKQRALDNRGTLERTRIEIAGKEEKLSFIEKNIEVLKQNNEERLEELNDQVIELEASIEKTRANIDILENQRDDLLGKTKEHASLKQRHSKLLKLQSGIETNYNRANTEIKFYSQNDNCPTCSQSIEPTFKQTKIDALNDNVNKFDKGLQDLYKEIDACIDAINEIDKTLKQADDLRVQITKEKATFNAMNDRRKDMIDQIKILASSDKLIDQNLNERIDVSNALNTLRETMKELQDEKQYIDTALVLLKDGGIKTKIIKQYLPIINKLINKYLAQMGFFVNFNIDENFEETIKSRYRDTFSYQNFSEGEKTRIDLAILFAWRAIAKMRNSASTNLLLFDEIFDGSLDNNGTDEFLKIMWSLAGDTHTFVISHKGDQLFDKFKKVYRFEKRKNFSRLAL